MWSANWHSQCGSSFPENGLLSNTCSGTAESPSYKVANGEIYQAKWYKTGQGPQAEVQYS
jgi:hypothetical protein